MVSTVAVVANDILPAWCQQPNTVHAERLDILDGLLAICLASLQSS
jgi:hypothetical protein